MKRVVRSSLERYNRVSNEYNEARARVDEQERVREDQKRKYNVERKSATDAVAAYVRAQIVGATSEEFSNDLRVFVDVDRWASEDYQTAEIRVDYGENRVSDESLPLKWSWRFKVDSKGRTSRESSSWSGLNATTSDHIAQLRQSVNALESLSNLDDERLVKLAFQNVPAYDEYVTQKVDNVDEMEYVYRKLDALTGEDVFVVGEPNMYSQYYYKILKDTGKQYTVEEWYLSYSMPHISGREKSSFVLYETRRYRKDKFYDLIKSPITLVTREQIQSIMDEKDRKTSEYNRKE